MRQIQVSGDDNRISFQQTILNTFLRPIGDHTLRCILQSCIYIIPHSLALFQGKYHLFAGTQYDGCFGNNQLLSQWTADTYLYIHTAKQLSSRIYRSLDFHHTIGIHQRINLRDTSFKCSPTGIRSNYHFISYLDKSKFIFQHREISFHSFGINNSTECFRSICRIIGLWK